MKKGSQARRKSLCEFALGKKKNAVKREISPSADGEEGYAPSTARAFEKSTRTNARTKTFINWMMLDHIPSRRQAFARSVRG